MLADAYWVRRFAGGADLVRTVRRTPTSDC